MMTVSGTFLYIIQQKRCKLKHKNEIITMYKMSVVLTGQTSEESQMKAQVGNTIAQREQIIGDGSFTTTSTLMLMHVRYCLTDHLCHCLLTRF